MIDNSAGCRWRLGELMAERGMRKSTELIPRLAEHGIELSRPQVYRIVRQQPQRISLGLIAALCDIFSCGVDELIAVPSVEARPVGAGVHPGGAQASCFPARSAGPARRRLLDALADSLVDVGYSGTTVADIVRRARTSRRAFYDHFPDKEACFVALLTEVNNQSVSDVTAAVDPHASSHEQIRQGVHAWIASVESRPALLVSLVRDLPALGMAARSLRRSVTETFIAMLQALSSTEEMRAAGVEPISRQRAILLIGGLRELMATTIESGAPLSDIAQESVAACMALGPLDPKSTTRSVDRYGT